MAMTRRWGYWVPAGGHDNTVITRIKNGKPGKRNHANGPKITDAETTVSWGEGGRNKLLVAAVYRCAAVRKRKTEKSGNAAAQQTRKKRGRFVETDECARRVDLVETRLLARGVFACATTTEPFVAAVAWS